MQRLGQDAQDFITHCHAARHGPAPHGQIARAERGMKTPLTHPAEQLADGCRHGSVLANFLLQEQHSITAVLVHLPARRRSFLA